LAGYIASPTHTRAKASINSRFEAGVAALVSFSNVVYYEDDSMSAKTPKKFERGERCFLALKKNEVTIFEHGSPKMAIHEEKDSM
jgi:hypothetical protein